jgi:hypothetical protein
MLVQAGNDPTSFAGFMTAAQDEMRQVNEDHRNQLEALDREFALRRSQLIQQADPVIGVVTDKMNLISYVGAFNDLHARRADQGEFCSLLAAIKNDYEETADTPRFTPLTPGGDGSNNMTINIHQGGSAR